MKSDQELEAVWSLIEGDSEETIGPTDLPLLDYKRKENEMNIRWLVDEPVSTSWLKVCSFIFSRVVYDERMFDILVKLVDHLSGNIKEAGLIEKKLIALGIERVFISNLDDCRDFVDSLHDFVSSGDIYEFEEFFGYRQIDTFINWMREHNMLRRSLASIFISMLKSETIDGNLANYILNKLLEMRWEIEDDIKQKGNHLSQLQELKSIVRESGRIGLVTSASIRRKIMSIEDSSISEF
jgi:hypothetical protein